MSDDIRYAWGESSLGDFIAALSRDGLVAFEFADRGAALERLRERFPSSILSEDVDGMSATVTALARLVDHPDEGNDIPFDPRGSDYEKRVWSLLREIPAGTTTSYGELAARMGTRDDGRDRRQRHRDPGPVPSRPQEGRLAVGLSLGRAAQARPARARAARSRI